MRVLFFAVLAAFAGVCNAIYPEDLWARSTKMTTDNFDATVKGAVDSGKTLFAPAWNAITKEFEHNSEVAFADVNLSTDRITGNHNPGAGGWPTIKYFNKETGYEGKAYTQKTSEAMCTELGPGKDYLKDFIMEAGNTSLCSAKTTAGCNEKEKPFIAQWEKKSLDDIKSQLVRLHGMKGEKMSPALSTWIGQRIAILKQFEKSKAAGHDEL